MLMAQLVNRPTVLLTIVLALLLAAGFGSSVWVGGITMAITVHSPQQCSSVRRSTLAVRLHSLLPDRRSGRSATVFAPAPGTDAGGCPARRWTTGYPEPHSRAGIAYT